MSIASGDGTRADAVVLQRLKESAKERDDLLSIIQEWKDEACRLRAEVEALKRLCDLQAMAIRQLERHRQLPKDIKDVIAVLRGEVEK